MATWFKDYILKLLIGFLLLALPVFYFVYTRASWNPLNPHDHLIQNGLAYVFLITFSYINHTIFVPRWFLSKQYKTYLIVAVCCVLGAVYLPYRIEQWAYFKPPQQNTPLAWFRQLFVEEIMLARPDNFQGRPGPNQDGFDGPPESIIHPMPPDGPSRRMNHFGQPHGTLLLPVKLLLFFLLGSVSTLISISVQTASRLRQVENDQLQAELRELRAQIQPHFLFNTLNSIYALAIRQDEKTADTIVKLSEFMRYTIRDTHRDRVPLTNEINYISNYIDLQKARLRDAVTVDYQLIGSVMHQQIAPLLLFSFIENAFKYGVSPEEDSLIRIHIDIREQNLQLDVINNKVEINQLEKSTGVGLANTRQRLRLLYPDTHHLRIDDTPTHFHVSLQLTLS
jgi:hypothetical protein